MKDATLVWALSGQEKEVEAVKPFSQEHATHAERVWTYLSKIFAKSPGDKTALYLSGQ